MSWYRVDRGASGGVPFLSARECAAAAVWRGSGSPQVLITNGNDASERFRDLVEFDPRTLACAKYPSAQQRGGAGAGATPVSAHSLTTCDGRFFYQFGGWDGMHDQAETARYDVSAFRAAGSGADFCGKVYTPQPAAPAALLPRRRTRARGRSCGPPATRRRRATSTRAWAWAGCSSSLAATTARAGPTTSTCVGAARPRRCRATRVCCAPPPPALPSSPRRPSTR